MERGLLLCESIGDMIDGVHSQAMTAECGTSPDIHQCGEGKEPVMRQQPDEGEGAKETRSLRRKTPGSSSKHWAPSVSRGLRWQ